MQSPASSHRRVIAKYREKQAAQLVPSLLFHSPSQCWEDCRSPHQGKCTETDFKRLDLFGVFFLLKNHCIRIHLEQRDTVLLVRIKLKTIINKIVMPRPVGRRYGLAFFILLIRFLLSPAKMGVAGEERGDLNVQPLFYSGKCYRMF